MNSDISELIKESMKLELLVSDLYTVFYKSFPDDKDFWWRLVLEEKNHAALFRSGLDSEEVGIKFPENLVLQELDTLKIANADLKKMIDDFNLMPPTRKEAFNIALELENSAVEIHYQQFMENGAESAIDRIFQELNKADKDHAARIRAYMEEHQIPFDEQNLYIETES
mgnify:CR=1 FL=1